MCLNCLFLAVSEIAIFWLCSLICHFFFWFQVDAHEDDVNAVCFADSSSQILFSGGDDGLCRVWDRRTLSEQWSQQVGTLAGHSDGITFIDTKVCCSAINI